MIERIQTAQLPDGVTPSLAPLTGGTSEFYRYRLVGAGYDPMSLRELQDWVVAPRLLQVPGVADVTTFGGLVRQYESARAALLTALVIPLSLLFALLCMYLSGVSLSLLSIGALDFGIIVDGTTPSFMTSLDPGSP